MSGKVATSQGVPTDWDSILSALLSTSSREPTTLHTTTSTVGNALTTPLNQLTGAYTAPSSTATTPFTGQPYETGSLSVGIQTYTVITQNGGLCRITYAPVTTTGTPAYATYTNPTTLSINTGLVPRDSATVITGTPVTQTTTGGIPIGTTEVPATDIPVCAAATASSSDGSDPETSSVSAESNNGTVVNHGLSSGAKAGIAIAAIIGLVTVMLLAGWWMYRRGKWRQQTRAQHNIWGPSNVVGGRNTEVTEGGQLVSGLGLRQALYAPRPMGLPR